MRSRSELLSYDTVAAEICSGDFHQYGLYFQQSGSANPNTVNTTMTLGSTFGTYLGYVNCYVGDLPIVKVGSYYHRDPTSVLARLNEWSEYTQTKSAFFQERSGSYAITNVPLLKSVRYRNMNDVVTPNFRKLKQDGHIVLSPMNASETIIECEVRTSTTGRTYSWPWTNFTSPSSSVRRYYYERHYYHTSKAWGIPPSEEENSFKDWLAFSLMDSQNAVNSAFDAVNSGDFDLPLFVAEGRETIATIGLAAVRLARIISKIKRLDFADLSPRTWELYKNPSLRSAGETFDVFTSAWLECRYAWRPLIGDVKSAMEFFSSDRNQMTRRTFRGFDDSSSSSSISSSKTINEGFGSYTINYDLSQEIENKSRAGVIVELSSSLASARSLGFTDIAGLAWELIPFSFVIDWFVNIKGILAALNPGVGLDQRGSFATRHGINTIAGTFSCSAPHGTETGLSITLRRIQKDRTVDNERTFLPLIDINFDIAKVIDAVSLLWRLR